MDMKRAAVVAGGLALAGVAVNVTIRAARRLWRTRRDVPVQDALVGRTCRITTQEVTETFGQASFEDGGAGLLLSVRCPSPNPLTRGCAARIVAYNPSVGLYTVTPVTD